MSTAGAPHAMAIAREGGRDGYALGVDDEAPGALDVQVVDVEVIGLISLHLLARDAAERLLVQVRLLQVAWIRHGCSALASSALN